MSELPTYEEVWNEIATLRDLDPRDENDTPTSDIIDALVDRGWLTVAPE